MIPAADCGWSVAIRIVRDRKEISHDTHHDDRQWRTGTGALVRGGRAGRRNRRRGAPPPDRGDPGRRRFAVRGMTADEARYLEQLEARDGTADLDSHVLARREAILQELTPLRSARRVDAEAFRRNLARH